MGVSIGLKKNLLLALKISLGSSLAIFFATQFGLGNAVSAGTITLLTLMNSKSETVRLSLYRLITFAVCVVIAGASFVFIDHMALAFGCYVFFTVLFADFFNLRSTISVNVVAGAHFFINQEFSEAAIRNEFILVLIGVVLAIVLNLFQYNKHDRKALVASMRQAEEDLRNILKQIANYLRNPGEHFSVWTDIKDLEHRLQVYIQDAKDYKENTFQTHPVYYIEYFEMRYDQCQVLHNLHASMRQIRTMPEQAEVVANYIIYLADYVIEKNHPEAQEIMLQKVFDSLKEEDLPETREEFESRALLFHIMKDLESFIKYKKEFVESLEKDQMDRYWRGFWN